ncbi:MAG: tetratricopeptide repeat protein [Spirochaetaceae bacterium]|jgi:tetratricopeptide (TPR) repeat protein|nr:tetratricopeptide repeat protein [Spirochaetaceae bacterium]
MKRPIALFLLSMMIFPLSAQEDKPDALAKYRSGRESESHGQVTEAAKLYNEAVEICMNEINSGKAVIDTYVVLTWTLQRQKKYADVIKWGGDGLKTQNDSRIIQTMGEAYFYMDNYEAALRNMKSYIKMNPQGDRVSTSYFFIGEIYRLQKKFHYADIAYTTAVRLEPGMALWWYRLGLVRESLGDKNYAGDAFERALRINPSYSSATEALNRVRKAVI